MKQVELPAGSIVRGGILEILLMNVSNTIRELCYTEAKAVCNALKLTYDKFNQDCCAAACVRTMAKVKTNEDRLQVAYVFSNASAVRQAISSEKATKAASIATSLIDLVK
jgi:hypothetical protein